MGVMLTLLSLFETRNSFLKLQCIGWGVIVIGLWSNILSVILCLKQVQKVAVELLLDEQHHQPLPLLHVRVRPPHHQLQLLEVCCLWFGKQQQEWFASGWKLCKTTGQQEATEPGRENPERVQVTVIISNPYSSNTFSCPQHCPYFLATIVALDFTLVSRQRF